MSGLTKRAAGALSARRLPMRLLDVAAATIGLLVALPASACSGEADAAGSRAPPMAQFTPAERQAASQVRWQQGSTAVRKVYGSDLHEPVPVVTATRAERDAAAQARRARVSDLNKAGLLPVSSDLDYPARPAR